MILSDRTIKDELEAGRIIIEPLGEGIGQISFLQMTTAADQPYGTGALGSTYKGQRGPTPSRSFENFRR